MEWLKKHTDSAVVLTAIIGSMLWMNAQFNDLRLDIARLDKDITVIKTVLLMKNIYPQELVKRSENES